MTKPDTLRDQPPAARVFVAAVVSAGGALLIASTWRGSLEHPLLLSSLLLLSACANTIKIPLPVGRSVSSLSVLGRVGSLASWASPLPGLVSWASPVRMVVATASQSTNGSRSDPWSAPAAPSPGSGLRAPARPATG